MQITTNPDEYFRQLIEARQGNPLPAVNHRGDDVALTSAINALAAQSATILHATQAAELLHCSIDTLRRIPIDELPTYEGVGRSAIYLRSDIEDYVRGRKKVAKRGAGRGCMKERLEPTPFVEGHNPADLALQAMKGP